MKRRTAALTGLLGLVSAAGLAGCVADPAGSTPDVRAQISQGQMASPRPAAVYLASVDAPAGLRERLEAALAAESKARDVTLSDANGARYLVRGYFNAHAADEGTAIDCVYDIFDKGKQRTQRIERRLTLETRTADPWSLVDDALTRRLAAASADELATFLATTPEALGTVQVSAEALPKPGLTAPGSSL